jgi:hypothetical protein
MGATTQPTTQVPVAPQVNRALQQSPDIPAFMKAEYAEAEKRKNAPLSEFMAERQAAMREAGVADASEGQQKLRAEMMAEKANMGEEKERQKHLRMAEFFASWGSTPGPVLVAGLNALQKTVPNIVADEKNRRRRAVRLTSLSLIWITLHALRSVVKLMQLWRSNLKLLKI